MTFRDDLEWSDKAGDEPFWVAVYQKMFPGCTTLRNKKDNKAQREGIDTIALLPNGKSPSIQEKKRREDWPDFALEFKHVNKIGGAVRPGWIEIDSQIDWLAYAFIASQICYFFPFQSLRNAWLTLKSEWLEKARLREDGFREIKSDAKGEQTYWSHSICVPKKTLIQVVATSQIISLNSTLPPAARLRQWSLFP